MPDATAFLSYTHKDDAFFGNYISDFRKSLEIGVHVVSGSESFRIFQDVDGIVIGEQWRKKIADVIDATSVFIPMLSPLFLNSGPCRDEVELFVEHEKALGRDDLILPVYFIEAPKLEKEEETAKDPIAKEIAKRQRFDWRENANLSLHDATARKAVLDLAREITRALDRIQAPAAPVPRSATTAPDTLGAQPQPQSGATPDERHREELVAGGVADAGRERPNEHTILWVDDRPSGNVWERRALETYGVRFVIARTTDEAVQLLRTSNFDAVISDMGRPGDPGAGFTLLAQVHGAANPPPYFIYCGAQAPLIAAEGKRRGAQLVTNDPDELVAAVVAALR
jgi:CheY-like chemotaxis protein